MPFWSSLPPTTSFGRQARRRRLVIRSLRDSLPLSAPYYLVPSFEREEQLVSGDLAFERGWDIQEIHPRVGGDARIHRQRVFLLLQRGRDGKWRFARGMSQAGPPA